MSKITEIYSNPIDAATVDAVNCRTERVEALIKRRMEAVEHLACERSRIVTDSWRETDGQPLDIRRAKLFRAVMEKNPVVIRDGELIVGSQSKYVLGASPSIDYNPSLAIENIENFKGKQLTDEDPELHTITRSEYESLAEDVEFWKGRSTGDAVNHFNETHFPWLQDWARSGLVNAAKAGNPPGAKNVNYGWVIQEGLESIIAKAKAEKAKLTFSDTPREDYQKEIFLDSVVIALEGAIEFSHRYSRLAAELAATESDPQRRAELEKISEVCRSVPAKPAKSFHEAVQSFWFIHLCENLETSFQAESPSRIDQYLYPMYRKDVIENGVMSRQEAAELLGCLFVKINELTCVKNNYEKNNIPGTTLQATTLCGVDREGNDASNELSYMLLEVLAQVKFPQPPIYVRYHPNIDRRVWMKALEVNIRRGDGNPAFMSDICRIPSFVDHGITLEDARDWAACGCAGSITPGISTHGGSLGINYINLAKVMEYVMNDGVDPRTGVQIGLKTGDVAEFTSAEQFIDAFKAQFDYLIAIMAKMARMSAYVDIENYHIPFISALLGDCIEKGMDARAGGVRYPQFLYHIADRGLQDVADSIAAIKKVVLEDKRITIQQLKEAMAANFEGDGHDYVRALMRSAPKYGNDDDYVDSIFSELSVWLQQRIRQERNPFGGDLWAGRSGANAHVSFGRVTGPLPNGHKAGEPIADGFCSPAQGCDVHGPTCVFNSASKAVHVENSTAALMNMKFEKKLFKNPSNIANLSAMLEKYFADGGFHVQINIIDKQTMLDAQESPDEYSSLMVRVAGYSAFFIDLPTGIQNEIISRTSEEM